MTSDTVANNQPVQLELNLENEYYDILMTEDCFDSLINDKQPPQKTD